MGDDLKWSFHLISRLWATASPQGEAKARPQPSLPLEGRVASDLARMTDEVESGLFNPYSPVIPALSMDSTNCFCRKKYSTIMGAMASMVPAILMASLSLLVEVVDWAWVA